MDSIRIAVITLLTINLLLLGVQASQPGEAGTITAATEPLAPVLPPIVLVNEREDPANLEIVQQCFTVGPFESRATVDAMVDMLGEYATFAQARTTEAFVDRGYWVFLPPFESERDARRAIKALYDSGHDDVRLILEGEWNRSVSLGYFINQANASNLVETMRALGFDAEMRVQRDDESRYWVDYRQLAGQEYASRVLAEFVPEALHRALSCENTERMEPLVSTPG